MDSKQLMVDQALDQVKYAPADQDRADVEAVFENWESEFLQDAAYVMLTVYLYQRGSPESKDPDKEEAVDADPRESQTDPNAPWPVRRGGAWLKLYENSLFLAFF
jgi:hypothetical protein